MTVDEYLDGAPEPHRSTLAESGAPFLAVTRSAPSYSHGP